MYIAVSLYLGYIGMDHVITEYCYKGTILQRYYRKMTYNYFVKFHGKKNLGPQHGHAISIPTPCYNEVHYKGTTVYRHRSGSSDDVFVKFLNK